MVVWWPVEMKIWLCVDFHEINKHIVDDCYPHPRVDDLIDGAGDGPVTYFSTLNLAKGFHQVPNEKNSQEKTAFVYPDGFMHWLFMPFGLKTCPSFFQQLMNHILHGLPKQKTECYSDDLLVKGTTFEDHVKTMKEILQ